MVPKYLFAAYFTLTNLCCVAISDFTKNRLHSNTASPTSTLNGRAAKVHHRRPFYIIGHMVNSLEEVDDFLEKGANGLEADIEFAADGTAVGTFHGAPCDCFRSCFSRENIMDYLEHIRDTASNPDSQFRGKVNLLLLDLHTDKLPESAKAKAGFTLTEKLWEYLWDGVPHKERVNVVLSIGHVKDSDVIKGALAYLQRKGKRHLLDKIGYDVRLNDPLKEIGHMYKQLGIKQHRWQGDGLSNCVRFLVPVRRLVQAVKARDSKEGYMDKVYHWTVDFPHFIKKSIGHGVDAIATNRPDNVLHVINSEPYRSQLRIAAANDSPWTRFRQYGAGLKQDRDTGLEALGGGEEIPSSANKWTAHFLNLPQWIY